MTNNWNFDLSYLDKKNMSIEHVLFLHNINAIIKIVYERWKELLYDEKCYDGILCLSEVLSNPVSVLRV